MMRVRQQFLVENHCDVLKMLILLLASVSSTVFGYAEPQRTEPVGYIVGRDTMTHVHIENLLSQHGIIMTFNGGFIHSVDVPPDKKKEAIQILRHDAKKRGYSIEFSKSDKIDALNSKLKLKDIAFAQALKLPAYSMQTALGRFLRRNDITQLALKYPYIGSLEVSERKYLTAPKRLRTGYEIDLEVRNAPKLPCGVYDPLTYYVDENGRDVEW